MNATSNDTTMTQTLETKVCGRCGGSGHYSYCQMYGTTCFGCAGRKVVFTKRGLAANEYLRKLRSKPATEINVGDQIQAESITMGGQPYSAWYTVESIAVNLSDRTLRIDLSSKRAGGLLLSNVDPASLIRVAQTAEQKAKTFKLALEYQATLTQAGTTRVKAHHMTRETEG